MAARVRLEKGEIKMRSIDAEALKKAVDTWDKFGYTAQGELIRLTEKNKDLYVPYVKYQDIVNCINNAPTVKYHKEKAEELRKQYELYDHWDEEEEERANADNDTAQERGCGMNKVSEVLTVTYDSGGGDTSCLVVARREYDKFTHTVISEFYGEEADKLYHELLNEETENE